MRHRPENILRITAPLRGFAHRFAYVFLLAAALGILLLGKADPLVFQRARTAVTDMTAPVLDALSRPAVTVSHIIEETRELARLRDENIILRAENERLLKWQNAARTLLAENKQLQELLGFSPPDDATSVTARVIGDSGGAFVRSILVNSGRREGVKKGNAALSGKGLLGRVAEVGDRSARVLQDAGRYLIEWDGRDESGAPAAAAGRWWSACRSWPPSPRSSRPSAPGTGR